MALRILTYRSDKGRYVRGAAFGMLVALAYYGAVTLRDFLSWNWARNELGFTIPVLEIPLTAGFLIALAVFVASVVAVRYAVNHPKAADLLIDTEEELQRVTWPTWPETWNGSVVVVVTVITMLVLLAGADVILSRLFEQVIF